MDLERRMFNHLEVDANAALADDRPPPGAVGEFAQA